MRRSWKFPAMLTALGLLATATALADSRTATPPRRLEDIHIEGEVPVPQVLFITARDQRRFMDFHHRRYLRTSQQLGEATALPTGSVVIRTGRAEGKEQQP